MPKDNHEHHQAYGDRTTLSRDELFVLESQIIPTFHRWLEIPGLAHHAVKSLSYWREEFDVPMHLRGVEERERNGN